ncbi:hypothetical protein [Acaryochloris marina]|uniref:hypothetical protein n=1 Tax=Acaryochloris marina TaxID=155978 RepID=UPI0011D0CAA4|nr:hypothetical protein [Acaryochloris marina]
MTPKRILSTALLSLSVLTVGISEATAAEIGLFTDQQEPEVVSVKFRKFGHRRHGFHGRRRFRRHHGRRRFRRFHRSPSFGFKKFKVLKKKHHDKHHDHHEHKFHHGDKGFFR